VIDGKTPETSERARGVVGAPILDEIAGGFGEEYHAGNEDEGPRKLDGDGDAVRARVVATGRRVIDDGSEEEADGDGQLVAADDDAADPLGRRLGLVERDCVTCEQGRTRSRVEHALRAEIRPTPKPAKKRPAVNRGSAVAAVCRMTPKTKTMVDVIRPHRRPRRSPKGAAVSAPKNVPAERMDTTCADCDGETSRLPLGST
jgi:hypothetical protein